MNSIFFSRILVRQLRPVIPKRSLKQKKIISYCLQKLFYLYNSDKCCIAHSLNVTGYYQLEIFHMILLFQKTKRIISLIV